MVLLEGENIYSLLTTIVTLCVAPLIGVLALWFKAKLDKIHTLCNGNLADATKKAARYLSILTKHGIDPDAE